MIGSTGWSSRTYHVMGHISPMSRDTLWRHLSNQSTSPPHYITNYWYMMIFPANIREECWEYNYLKIIYRTTNSVLPQSCECVNIHLRDQYSGLWQQQVFQEWLFCQYQSNCCATKGLAWGDRWYILNNKNNIILVHYIPAASEGNKTWMLKGTSGCYSCRMQTYWP